MAMKITVRSILGIKRLLGKSELVVTISDGNTLKSLIDEMVETFGVEFSTSLYGHSENEILPFIRLMINGRDIEFLDGQDTVLYDGDEVLILPPISGG